MIIYSIWERCQEKKKTVLRDYVLGDYVRKKTVLEGKLFYVLSEKDSVKFYVLSLPNT
jgi:hypothetical protein